MSNTVTTNQTISITDIKSGTGSSANDLGSYYRSLTNAGWTPASGAISYNDLRGAFQKIYPIDYNGYGFFSSSYAYVAGNPQTTCWTTYGGYYFYYYTLQGNLYYRGDCFYADVGYYIYPGGGVTAARAVCYLGYYNTSPYMPMGMIGDSGGNEICAVSTPYCTIGGWYYYYDKYSIAVWAHQTGVGYDSSSYGYYGWVGGGVWNWVYYHNGQSNGYGFGARIDTGGTLHVGRYYTSNITEGSAPSSITVAEESSITGSSYLFGRQRQNGINGGEATEITGGVNFYYYAWKTSWKNCYQAPYQNLGNQSNGSTWKGNGNQGWT